MTSLTALYLDFASPHSYRAWRWLAMLPGSDRVDIRPYSPDLEGGEPCNPWDRTTISWGLELLALGELARESGRATHEAYCAAAFATLHERHDDIERLEAWLALGAEVGVDLRAYSADAERWRAEVGLWQVEAQDNFGISEVPSLVFSSGDDESTSSKRPTTLVLCLDDDIAGPEEASHLLDDLIDLAVRPVAGVHRVAPSAP